MSTALTEADIDSVLVANRHGIRRRGQAVLLNRAPGRGLPCAARRVNESSWRAYVKGLGSRNRRSNILSNARHVLS